jgi:hypothetical protein
MSHAAVTGSELRVHAVDGIHGCASPANAANRNRIGLQAGVHALCASLKPAPRPDRWAVCDAAPRGDLDS